MKRLYINPTRVLSVINHTHSVFKFLFIRLFAFSLLYGCGSLTATYDHYSYIQTVDIKLELLHLMQQADKPFSLYEKEVEAIQKKIEKVYEYEKGRFKNEITITMWEKFKSPDKNLFGGFIKRWKEKKVLSPFFIKESKKSIRAAIDQIIGLESGKAKGSDIQNK